jgi:hypothetical protein
MGDVIEPGAVVNAVRGAGKPTLDELVEQRVALLAAVGDAGEGRILSFHTETGVPHDEHEEARLTLREAEINHRVDAFGRHHSQSSSASPRLRAAPLPPPLRPLILTLNPR